MNRFILDASVALSWFIDPSITPLGKRAQQLLVNGGRAVVPHLWRPEVANGFVIARRRNILTAARCAQALSELELLLAGSIETLTHEFSVQRLVAVSQKFALTAYDATYLETALELQLPLATLDQQLSVAAMQAGVALIT